MVIAQDGDQSTDAASRAALAAFSETNPYLNQREDRTTLLDELSNRCSELTRNCALYVRENRSEVLTALPNNPDYWGRFEAFLQQGSLGQIARSADDLPKYQRVIDAAKRWPLRDLAKDGQLAAEKVASYWSQARLRLAQSNTTLEKVLFLQILDIFSDTLNYAMAQEAERDRPEQLALLAPLATPMSLAERSFGLALAGEFELIQMNLNQAGDNYESVIARMKSQAGLTEADLITREQFEALTKQKKLYLRQLPKLFDALTQSSELSAAAYWSDPLQTIIAAFDTLESNPLLERAAPTWQNYVASAHLSAIRRHVLQALADVYTGDATYDQAPQQAAPDHWSWEWRTPANQPVLCLVPTDTSFETSALCKPVLVNAS